MYFSLLLACLAEKPSDSHQLPTETPEPTCDGFASLDCKFGEFEEVFSYTGYAYPFLISGDVTVCELGCEDPSVAVAWMEEKTESGCASSESAVGLPLTLTSEKSYLICLLGMSAGRTPCRLWTSAGDRQPTAVITDPP